MDIFDIIFIETHSSVTPIASLVAYTVTERCTKEDSTCIIPESECGMNASCDCNEECFNAKYSPCQSGIFINKLLFKSTYP